MRSTDLTRREIIGHWLAIAGIASLDLVGMAVFGFRLDPAGLIPIVGAMVVLGIVGGVYGYLRPDERLFDLALVAAQLLTLFSSAAVLSYIATATNLPLWDGFFAGIDASLGLDWHGVAAWFAKHPILRLNLQLAYASVMLQLVGVPIYLALSGQPKRTSEMIWLILFGSLVVIPISAGVPCLGAYHHYQVVADPEMQTAAEVMGIRDGSLRVLNLLKLKGIVTFPSFHVVLAVASTYVTRARRGPFIVLCLVNSLMILSVPTEGGHYFIDVVGGLFCGLVAILLTRGVRVSLSNPVAT